MNITEKHKGLTKEQVEENRKKYGANEIAPPKRDPWYVIYLETFEDPIIRLLLIAIGLSLMIAGYKYFTTGEVEWYEPMGVIVAVFLATYVGFINTFKAMKQFDVLNQLNSDIPVTVVRNGNITQVSKSEIVVEDIVILETGVEIPADGEVLESTSLQVSESKLTGESVPVTKLAKDSGGAVEDNKTAYPRYKCLSSTNVIGGYGVMLVTEVGEHTEIGKTTKDALVENEDASPLQKQLDKTAQAIGVVAFSVAALLFTLLIVKGYMIKEITTTLGGAIILGSFIAGGIIVLIPVWLPILYDFYELIGKEKERPSWLEEGKTFFKTAGAGALIAVIGLGIASMASGNLMAIVAEKGFLTSVEILLGYFMIAVTLIVVAVPEGLPMATTMGLAYSMKKMMKQNVLVKRMMACEAIGAVTVICTDKTGTLTMNEMRVKDTGFGIPIDEFIYEAVAVNGTANLDRSVKPATVVGNPTEGAFLLFLESRGVDYGEYRANFKTECLVPFTTENKYMATAGESAVNGKHVVFVKGAPEKIMDYTIKEANSGEKGEYLANVISESRKIEILDKITTYQNRGMRVIGLAFEEVEDAAACMIEKISPNLTWLGYIVIEDPPRPEVPDAIEMCKKAGIDVKIITGDNPLTAAEIGNQVNIEPGGKLHADHLITSTEYNELKGNEQIKRTLSLKVLARAKPQDKLTMVRILKDNGHVVAMTGDGTNDAPAMNDSDCGIAMGKTGTSTAKEAADLILLDDSFSSIVTGVLWGRSIYLNIQRFILFQLTVNFTAILIAVLGPFIGIQLPLTVIQMLWVNLIMDTFAALALATEPPSQEAMNNPPRNPKEFIVTKAISKNIISMGSVFVIVLIAMIIKFQENGINTKELSIFFSTFVILQFWNLFNARAFGNRGHILKGLSTNKTFMGVAVVILVLQIIMVQFGGKIFRTVPLSVMEWVMVIGLTSLVVIIPGLINAIAGKIKKAGN